MVLDIVRALTRRWYVVLLGLILTVGLAYGAYALNPPEYHTRALVLLVPSKQEIGVGANPLLSLTGLEQPASVVAAFFSSTTAQQEVQRVSPTAQFSVGLDDSSRGPILALDVTDQAPDGAMATLNHLRERVPEQLTQLQRDMNAPPEALISSMTITADEKPTAVWSNTVRGVIAAAVVGLAGAVLSANVFDGWRLRRAASQQAIGERPRYANPGEAADALGSANLPATGDPLRQQADTDAEVPPARRSHRHEPPSA